MVSVHQKTVVFRATDRIVKHSSFVDLCASAVGLSNAAVVEIWLLKEHRIVKTAAASLGRQEVVVKFCTKGETITETDVGILRYKVSSIFW